MTAQEANGWLHYGGGLQLWRELYAPFGVVPFAGGSTGVQMAGWFNIRLNNREDLNGLKMRIPGLAGEVFDAAGGSAVRIAGGEVYTSMQTGVIDAVEWVGPYNDRTLGLMEVGDYYYYPGWHEPGAMLEIIVNADALAALPADLTGDCAGCGAGDEYRYAGRLSPPITANHCRFYSRILIPRCCRSPMTSWTHCMKAAKWRFSHWYERTLWRGKIAASYFDFAERVRTYHEISERAYLNGRDRLLPPVTLTAE